MRLLSKLIRSSLLLLVPLSPLAAQVTQVVADTDIGFDANGPCNELDAMGSHRLVLVELNTTFDSGYPLNVGGQLRMCGFLSVLLDDCEASLPGPQQKGRTVSCSTFRHGVGCKKEYIGKTTGSLGNAFLEVDGDAHSTGCQGEPCAPHTVHSPAAFPPLTLAQRGRGPSLLDSLCLP
jgi:hypothetical protein